MVLERKMFPKKKIEKEVIYYGRIYRCFFADSRSK